jgi:hypothetical protein
MRVRRRCCHTPHASSVLPAGCLLLLRLGLLTYLIMATISIRKSQWIPIPVEPHRHADAGRIRVRARVARRVARYLRRSQGPGEPTARGAAGAVIDPRNVLASVWWAGVVRGGLCCSPCGSHGSHGPPPVVPPAHCTSATARVPAGAGVTLTHVRCANGGVPQQVKELCCPGRY